MSRLKGEQAHGLEPLSLQVPGAWEVASTKIGRLSFPLSMVRLAVAEVTRQVAEEALDEAEALAVANLVEDLDTILPPAHRKTPIGPSAALRWESVGSRAPFAPSSRTSTPRKDDCSAPVSAWRQQMPSPGRLEEESASQLPSTNGDCCDDAPLVKNTGADDAGGPGPQNKDVNSPQQVQAIKPTDAEMAKSKRMEFAHVFTMMDLDGNGCLGTEELGATLRAMGASPAMARKLIKKADTSGDGLIHREEFLRVIQDDDFAETVKQIEKWNLTGGTPERIRYRCMMRQSAPQRVAWDCLIASLLGYIAIVAPLSLGIIDMTNATLNQIDMVVSFIFLFDCALNFRTGYYSKDGFEVLDWQLVAKHYFQTWFLLDFLSSLPMDLITEGTMENLQHLKLFRNAKVLRLIRLVKITKVLKILGRTDWAEEIEEFILLNGIQKRMALLGILMITALICHWMGCFMVFSGSGFLDGYQDVGDDKGKQYIAAIYWAMTTMTTVGYGDITPGSDWERLYAMASMIIGGAFYGFVIGKITSIISEGDIRSRITRERMEEVNAWLTFHQFPKDVCRRVRKYFNKHVSKRITPDEHAIIDTLSPELRSVVSEFMVKTEVRECVLFQNLPGGVMARLVKITEEMSAEPGEIIARFNEVAHHMFIITAGTVEVEYEDGKTKQLALGDSFGEEAVLKKEGSYRYTAKATSHATLQSIPAEPFFAEFQALPKYWDEMEITYQKMVESRKSSGPSAGGRGGAGRGPKDPVLRALEDLRTDVAALLAAHRDPTCEIAIPKGAQKAVYKVHSIEGK